MRLKLHTKFLIPTTLVLVLVMGLATFVSYTVSSQAIRRMTEEQLMQLTEAALTTIESWVDEQKQDIMLWAQHDVHRLVIQDDNTDPIARDAANQSLAKLRQEHEFYEYMVATNARGDVVSASNPELIGKVNMADRVYFRLSMQGKIAVADVISSRGSGKPVFGDAGKGFAVVADEVRNLAIRSAEAAKNTAQMLEESVQNAEAGVALHQEVLTNLEEITTGAQRGNVMMGEIATASDQQQQGIAQINVAVDQINHVTQQTAANAQQAASTATELAGQAEALQRLLTVFNLTRKEVTTRAWTQPTLPAPRQHIQASHTSKELEMVGQNSRSHNISAPLRSEDVIPFDDEDGTTLQEF